MQEGFSTMDMEALLEVPEYTILYWERCLPLVVPRKQFGRRQFSIADACLLLRMRHYVLDKNCNPSRAGNKIVEERLHAARDELHALHGLRCELINLYCDFLHFKNSRKKISQLQEVTKHSSYKNPSLFNN